MPVDINRGTSGVNLPPEVATEIWSATATTSAVMSAATPMPLPGTGVNIPIITGNAEAAWVAETEEKPVSKPGLNSKTMTAYTLSVIVPFSNQFRRDASTLYSALVEKLPYALAEKFDATVAGAVAAPGSNFDTLASAPAVEVDETDTFGDLARVLNAVAAADGDLSHWIASPALHGILLTTRAADGRQLFVPAGSAVTNEIGSIFGAPVLKTKSRNLGTGVVGLAGDFAGGAVWGSVEGVQMAISDQATLNINGTPTNLFQRNMFAVRAEIEVGFRVKDVSQFARITPDTP